jgi:L-amino acid N-acyltransferase YncA
MSIDVRPACVDDLGAITEIYADAVLHGTSSYEIDPPGREEMRARFDALAAGGFPYLVATQGPDSVLGYAYAGPFRPRPAYRFMVEDSIYVAPAFHGRGIGQTLLDHLVAEVAARGFRQILAVIGDGSASSPSVRLHERAGFSHCGTIAGSGFKHGRWLDTVLMQLPLNGGSERLPDAGR